MILERIIPTDENAQVVMDWLNHNRPNPYVLPTFMDEFIATYFKDTTLPPLFAMKDGEKIGWVQFSHYPRVLPPDIPRACAINVMVAPAERGKGYSNSLVALATDYIHRLGWAYVVAEINEKDIKTIRLFSRLGYYMLDKYNIETATILRFVHHL